MKRFIHTVGLAVAVLWLWRGGMAFAMEPRMALVIGNGGHADSPLAYSTGPGSVAAAETAPSGFDERRMELSFRQSISDSADPAGFVVYLAEYPTGIFAALARPRVKQLEEQQVAAVAQQTESEVRSLAAKEEERSRVSAGVAISSDKSPVCA